MRDPLKLLLFFPVIPMVWGGLQLHLQYLGWIPQQSLKSIVWIIALSLVMALLVAWVLKKSSSQERLTLEMKLNSVVTGGGESFTGAFSSDTRFLADLEEFQNVLHAVAWRDSRNNGCFRAWRERATVKIWPGPLGCGFHAIRPPSPLSSGQAFHGHLATCSTAIRPGSRSAATQGGHC